MGSVELSYRLTDEPRPDDCVCPPSGISAKCRHHGRELASIAFDEDGMVILEIEGWDEERQDWRYQGAVPRHAEGNHGGGVVKCPKCGLPMPGPHRGTCKHSLMMGGIGYGLPQDSVLDSGRGK